MRSEADRERERDIEREKERDGERNEEKQRERWREGERETEREREGGEREQRTWSIFVNGSDLRMPVIAIVIARAYSCSAISRRLIRDTPLDRTRQRSVRMYCLQWLAT